MSRRPVLMGTLMTAVAGLLFASCKNNVSANDPVIYRWTFGAGDLEDWEAGSDGAGGWGTVVGLNDVDAFANPPPADEGCAKLDGVGDPGEPNAWIFLTDLVLPADARTLSFYASGHNKDGANALLRVRLVDGDGVSHTLLDWDEFTGSLDVRNWEPRTASVSAFAGQTVTLYFEQDDNGPGTHEQIYLDEIRILRD